MAERGSPGAARGTIGILDDAPARIAAMRAVTDGHAGVAVVDHLDAADFLAWLRAAPDLLFVSLDHDLGPSRMVAGERRDPGIGMDVVRPLVDLPLRDGPPPDDTGPDALVDALERLAALHASGALTDDEFRDAKAGAIHRAAADRAP